MKKLKNIIVLLFIAAFLFAGCSKEPKAKENGDSNEAVSEVKTSTEETKINENGIVNAENKNREIYVDGIKAFDGMEIDCLNRDFAMFYANIHGFGEEQKISISVKNAERGKTPENLLGYWMTIKVEGLADGKEQDGVKVLFEESYQIVDPLYAIKILRFKNEKDIILFKIGEATQDLYFFVHECVPIDGADYYTRYRFGNTQIQVADF